MKRTRKGRFAYMVLRLDANGAPDGGAVFRGDTPKDAAQRAARHRLMRGAAGYLVKSFAGDRCQPTTFTAQELGQ